MRHRPLGVLICLLKIGFYSENALINKQIFATIYYGNGKIN